MRYAIVIEKAESNFAAYVPDLPGCIATGTTVKEVERLIQEAIEFYIEGLRTDGLPIPKPLSKVEYVNVAGACFVAELHAWSPSVRLTKSRQELFDCMEIVADGSIEPHFPASSALSYRDGN